MADRDFEDIEGEETFVKVVHFAAESALEASDEEIREAMLEAGEDPKENADRLRAKMFEAAERGRKHRLKVLRKRWKRRAARIQELDHGLPETSAARLSSRRARASGAAGARGNGRAVAPASGTGTRRAAPTGEFRPLRGRPPGGSLGRIHSGS